MSNFKKLSDVLQFSPEKMKKNGVFETDRFFCDTYCFEPGQEQSPIFLRHLLLRARPGAKPAHPRRAG